MKEEGDVFKKCRDSFSRMEGHFHILEQRVPVELQMEYFKYSENVRKENRPPRPLSEDECETLYNTLLTEETKDKTEKQSGNQCDHGQRKSIFYDLIFHFFAPPFPKATGRVKRSI